MMYRFTSDVATAQGLFPCVLGVRDFARVASMVEITVQSSHTSL